MQMCRLSGLVDPRSRTPSTRRGAVRKVPVRCGGGESSSGSAAVESDFDAKSFRRNLTRSENYNRKGFGHKEETLQLMSREYTSWVSYTPAVLYPHLRFVDRVIGRCRN